MSKKEMLAGFVSTESEVEVIDLKAMDESTTDFARAETLREQAREATKSAQTLEATAAVTFARALPKSAKNDALKVGEKVAAIDARIAELRAQKKALRDGAESIAKKYLPEKHETSHLLRAVRGLSLIIDLKAASLKSK